MDDIIFVSTRKELCNAFERLMHGKFQMSSIGELTFFLGLQVKQKNDGIFISQDKYVAEILKKFQFTEVKNASTPMETQKPLFKDEDGKEVDVHMYRSMISSLMYFTSLRPDIMFAMYACPRYQVNLKVLHLHAVKRTFRQLLQIPQQKLNMWLLQVALDKCFGFRINYLIMGLAKKSVRLMVEMLFEMDLELILLLKVNDARHNLLLLEQFWSTTLAKTINGEAQTHARVDGNKNIEQLASMRIVLVYCYGKTINEEAHIHVRVDGKKVIISKEFIRRDLQLADE
nr:uncharacterized mitochondrial protein AtMg00810-like [Tanacetum cinerariifolium]